ncbi:hypothetical protein OHB01_19860 [Microbispora hainanensis]|uniref:Uncharacterized protein n=1 Tax=Microbispora hainanensis TaxID=568844 RepID=A0A544YWX7_9ACTN|nr:MULTISPECIES: hypothetical protein [Microbispora]NJP24817.1 hypothetical protein [Microbispora sp. CL1-1]TQS14284.1 hypothetical protein FLW53_11475 [Microbispora sp. SCL1-1]TQS21257.1 hypothetical protein FLX08_12330 [Microbispora hainanensis]
MSYVDPPAPTPLQPGETPPAPSSTDLLSPGGQPTGWVFNPEYQKLVDLWLQVVPLMDQLTKSLDKPYERARSRDVWDAPVAERYVQDLAEWRNRLGMYRQAVLTAISDQAADTPRWIPAKAGAPHAFTS